WEMVLPDSDGVSRVPPYSGYRLEWFVFRLRGFHSLWLSFPTHSTILAFFLITPVLQPQRASSLVWALPVSLAATQGIEYSFSSCNYLDVSVHCVFLLICYVFTYK